MSESDRLKTLVADLDTAREERDEARESERVYRGFVNAIYAERLLDWCRESGYEEADGGIDHAKAMGALIADALGHNALRAEVEELREEKRHAVDDAVNLAAQIRQIEDAVGIGPLSTTSVGGLVIALRAEVERKDKALTEAANAMTSVRVFVASREQAKQPEGIVWFDGQIAKARAALDDTTSQLPAQDLGPLREAVAKMDKYTIGRWWDAAAKELEAAARQLLADTPSPADEEPSGAS